MNSITILAKHIFFDLSFNFLDDVYPKNLTAQGALSWLLNHAETPTNFTASGNCTSTSNARYVRKNIVDAIYNEDNALLNRFGGELSFNNFAITVNEKRGTDANFSIRYKKNLTGIDFNLDFSNVATRIIPIGFDGLTIDSLYVESPKVSSYFTPLYKTYEFGNIKYDPDDEEAYHTLAEAKQALINAANDLFNKGADVPSVSIKVNFVELAKCTEYENYSNLESVNLGDTIGVVIPELNINTTARVVKTVYDCILKRFTTLEIGSVTPSATTNQIEVNNQVKKTENYINEAQKNAESLINHPFKGNLYIDDTPGSGTIYFMDTTNPATAQSIWKWSIGGLGYSPNGINGTYTIGITQDGRINADFITTGHLDTSVIEGYDSLVLQVLSNTRNLDPKNELTSLNNTYHIEDAMQNGLIKLTMDGKSIQDGTPSPDTPVEIESVGYTNLFNYTPVEVTQVKSTSRTHNANADKPIELKAGTYTLSMPDLVMQNNTRNMGVDLMNNSTHVYVGNVNNDHKSFTFNIASDTILTHLYIYISSQDADNATATYTNIQIEKGDIAHQYINYGKYGIEYKTTNGTDEQTYLITLDQPLRRIGNIKDKLRVENGMLFVDRNIRHAELAIADMNNNQNYPGWANKPETQQMYKDYPNKNASLTGYGISWQCNILPSSKSPSLNTMSPSGIIFIPRSHYDYSETQWKTLYPNLVFKLDYVMPSTETEELGSIDIPMLENINNIDIFSNINTDSYISYSRNVAIANYVASSIKLTTDSIEAQVEDNTNGLNSANFTINAQGATLDVISTNIDKENGDINSVTTKEKKFTFNDNGLTITNSASGYKRVADEEGDRYYDGTAEVAEYTKDGSKQKDLSLFGTYKYGMKDFNDTPKFAGQLYTATIRGNSRTGFGHFKNS